MDMSGEYRIPARREKVWAALNDPDILRQAIPGCEELIKHSDTELEAKVTAKVGPVKAKFGGNVRLENINAPESYTIAGEGKGGAAGFARGGADVSLAEDGDGTILRYAANAEVGGKLAQIGSRLIQGTSKKMADQFFGKFSEIVTGLPDDYGPAASTSGAQAGIAVSAAATDAGEKLGDAAADATDAVRDAAASAGEKASDAASDAADSVGQAAASTGEAVSDAAASAGEKASDAASDAAGSVRQAATSAGEAVSDATAAVRDAAASAGEKISDAASAAGETVSGAAAAASATASTRQSTRAPQTTAPAPQPAAPADDSGGGNKALWIGAIIVVLILVYLFMS